MYINWTKPKEFDVKPYVLFMMNVLKIEKEKYTERECYYAS